MKFYNIYNIIVKSETFQNFKKENPNAGFCAGFFILDFLSNDSKKSLDFKVNDEIFTFELLDSGTIKLTKDKMLEIENNKNNSLLTFIPEIKIDLDELKGLSGMKALDEGIHSKFNKIIAVLQIRENKQIWNLTCMLDGLIILSIIIDAKTREILKFERKSMMDLIRKNKS